jgi:hypothetical protein
MKNIIQEILKIWQAADELDKKRDGFLESVQELAKALKKTNDLAEKYKHVLVNSELLYERCRTIKEIDHRFLTGSTGTALKIMGRKCVIDYVDVITSSEGYEIKIKAREII